MIHSEPSYYKTLVLKKMSTSSVNFFLGRLDFDKACATMLERLKIGGIILKSNVWERETSTDKR